MMATVPAGPPGMKVRLCSSCVMTVEVVLSCGVEVISTPDVRVALAMLSPVVMASDSTSVLKAVPLASRKMLKSTMTEPPLTLSTTTCERARKAEGEQAIFR